MTGNVAQRQGLLCFVPIVALVLLSQPFYIAAQVSCNQTMADMEVLVPPYLKTLGAPVASVSVYFPAAGNVNFGEVYSMTKIQESPAVYVQGPGLQSTEYYSLITVDPDSDNITMVNILHLLVVNIPGSISPSQDVLEVGDVLSPWLRPAIPRGVPTNGNHRHMYLIFEQGEQKIPTGAYYPQFGFSILNFTAEFGLRFPFAGFLYRDYPDVFYDPS